jgi:hypothetical protein
MTPGDDLEGTKVDEGFELPKPLFVVLPDPEEERYRDARDAHRLRPSMVKIEDDATFYDRYGGALELFLMACGVAALFDWVLIPLWRYFNG